MLNMKKILKTILLLSKTTKKKLKKRRKKAPKLWVVSSLMLEVLKEAVSSILTTIHINID